MDASVWSQQRTCGKSFGRMALRWNNLRRRLHGKRRVPSFQLVHPVFMPGRIRGHQALPPHSDSTPSEVAVLSPRHSFIYRPRRWSSCSNSAAICDQQPGLGSFHAHRGFGGRSVRQIILLFNKNKHGMMGACSGARFLMKVFFVFFLNQTLLHKSLDGIFYQSASCYEQQGFHSLLLLQKSWLNLKTNPMKQNTQTNSKH